MHNPGANPNGQAKPWSEFSLICPFPGLVLLFGGAGLDAPAQRSCAIFGYETRSYRPARTQPLSAATSQKASSGECESGLPGNDSVGRPD